MAAQKFQSAIVILIFVIPVELLMTWLFLSQAGDNPMMLLSFAGMSTACVLVSVLFYGMTTTIEDNVLRISYGIGVIRKTILLSEVKTVHVITTPWYHGWGIRVIPNGMLYNIRGLLGVELSFRDKHRIIRIGSGRAQALQEAIEEVLRRRR
jgi:hypothetical protein